MQIKNLFRKPAAALVGIILLAFIQRAYVLAVKLTAINSDEAIIGLMARHILAGERPFFYYGQSYYGPLDTYLNGLIFSIWGSSDLTLRVLPFLGSLLFVAAVYALGKRIYSVQVGLISALFAALCPAFLAVRGLKGDAAYTLVLLIGTLSLILFQDWLARPSRLKLAGLAALTLLGIWVLPLMLYYVFAMLAAWVVTRIQRPLDPTPPHRSSTRTILLLAGTALVIGAAGLALKGTGAVGWLSRLVDASGLFTVALPVLWGWLPPAEDNAMFMRDISSVPAWGMALITLLSLAVLVAGLVYGARRPSLKQPLLFIFITGSGLIYVLFFVMVGISPTTLSFPRYLFPIYSGIPFWVDGLLGLTRQKRLLQAVSIAAVLAVNIYSVLSLPVVTGPSPSLLTWFAENPSAGGVYTDYWTGYWLAFESQERIIPVIVSDDHRLSGGNRYPPYVEQARAWREPVFLYYTGAAGEASLRSFLSQHDIRFERTQVGAYILYHSLSKAVVCRPDGLELSELQP